ncbi:MAG: iron-sulfur cluster insertion protein ErpA [Deltaproteobacteria bacterium]|nr:iron-sulfur cluster insertion protein ErpA [Deltaproteobacteria bacterium]
MENLAIHLSETAAAKIKEFGERLPEAKGKTFRVFVQGGGCSGYTYGFKFDEKKENDVVVEENGATCVVDPVSLSFLKDSVVNYSDDMSGSGFKVENPNAKAACGCGVSFTV